MNLVLFGVVILKVKHVCVRVTFFTFNVTSQPRFAGKVRLNQKCREGELGGGREKGHP